MEISEYKNIYDNERTHWWYVSVHEYIAELIRKYQKATRKELSVCDAGCGTGGLLAMLQPIEGLSLSGFDFSAEAIKFCGLRKLSFAQRGSILEIPYPDNSFDVVVSVDVIYVIETQFHAQALRELYRVLKPGGLLILHLPAYEWLRSGHDVIVHTKHRFTLREARTLVQQAGFAHPQISYRLCLLFPLALFQRLLDRFRQEHPSAIQPAGPLVNTLLLSIMRAENVLLRHIRFPFGLSIIGTFHKPAAR